MTTLHLVILAAAGVVVYVVLGFIVYRRGHLVTWWDWLGLPLLGSIVAGLLVLLISLQERRAYTVGYAAAERVYEAKLQSAIDAYSRRLGDLIIPANDDPRVTPVVRARSIVATRNDLSASLTSLPRLMDSEIDTLEAQLSPSRFHTDHDIIQTMEVLRLKWPSKTVQIEMETRKLIAELGFTPTLEKDGNSK